jgi:hypothetical protein
MSNNSLRFSTQLSQSDYDLLKSIYLSVKFMSLTIEDDYASMLITEKTALSSILTSFIELFISYHHNRKNLDLLFLKRIIVNFRLYESHCTVDKSLLYKEIGIDMSEFHNKLAALLVNLIESK